MVQAGLATCGFGLRAREAKWLLDRGRSSDRAGGRGRRRSAGHVRPLVASPAPRPRSREAYLGQSVASSPGWQAPSTAEKLFRTLRSVTGQCAPDRRLEFRRSGPETGEHDGQGRIQLAELALLLEEGVEVLAASTTGARPAEPSCRRAAETRAGAPDIEVVEADGVDLGGRRRSRRTASLPR